jgi:acyl-CoA reductase-like NAD-dependent aldehyde dehydrogenase
MATDRIIVQSSVADNFLKIAKDNMAKSSKEMPLPKMVSLESKTRLGDLLSEAMSQGATVAFGGSGSEGLPGTAFIPTILEDVSVSTQLEKEESFGPVVSIARVNSEEEAVALANSSAYGLSASIFTKDLRKGLAIAKKIESG